MNRTPWHEKYKVNLPEGVSGNFSIRRVTVDEQAASAGRLRAAISGSSFGRFVPAGSYTMLYETQPRGGETLWMSDTPDEIRDHIFPIHEAERRGGHVLINGLGIGMVANAILSHENVEKVTVIELSEDVISLVVPTLHERYGDRLEVVHANAYEYKPRKGIRYSVCWHDIWVNLCTDNLQEMAKLHRKYGRRCDWQGSWGRELLQSQRRRERASGW